MDKITLFVCKIFCSHNELSRDSFTVRCGTVLISIYAICKKLIDSIQHDMQHYGNSTDQINISEAGSK